VTGPGKLTVGKLYGGILIYEIWKTTRYTFTPPPHTPKNVAKFWNSETD